MPSLPRRKNFVLECSSRSYSSSSQAIDTARKTATRSHAKHAAHGGPQGLYSISGIKFTTSRLVAEKALEKIFPEKCAAKLISINAIEFSKINEKKSRGIFELNDYSSSNLEEWKPKLLKIIETESARNIEDIIIRRSNLWENPEIVKQLTIHCKDIISRDDSVSDHKHTIN